jgi:hypothetical protein
VAGPKRRATLRNIMLGEVVKTFKPQKWNYCGRWKVSSKWKMILDGPWW